MEVESGGARFTVEADEIIVSAGAVGSPQLLMLSGVGPPAHLRAMGLPVVLDLSGVGQNMRDHPGVGVRTRVKEGFPLHPNGPRAQVCLRYTVDGSSTRNDMIITPSSFDSDIRMGGDPLKATGVSLGCVLQLAEGSGGLTLASPDPHVQPYIDYRYLVEPRDRQRLREAVRLCIRLLEHHAYLGIIEARTAPTDDDLASDGALDAWLLKNVRTSYHISGTCKMGPASDRLAVVDQYCRVHGLEGLRVVDASVMPDVIRANTNATTVMIGERAADLIVEQI